jgi:hypothetical protein
MGQVWPVRSVLEQERGHELAVVGPRPTTPLSFFVFLLQATHGVFMDRLKIRYFNRLIFKMKED